MTEEALKTLETKKSRLNDIQKEKIERMMLRSRSRYEDLADSGYFKMSNKFYEDLYKQCDHKDNTTIQLVLGENESKLSDKDSHDLEGEILYSEIALTLTNMKNNKSPGLDGFTVECF